MATKLDKPVTRETTFQFQSRRVIVTLSPATPPDFEKMTQALPERIEFRQKGTRQRAVSLPLKDLFVQACRAAAGRNEV